MGTLAIIRRLWYYGNWPDHPLVRRDREQAVAWANYAVQLQWLYRVLLRSVAAVVLIGAVLEVVRESQVSFLMSTLTILLPLIGIAFLGALGVLLVIWTVPLTLGGISILRERASQTWELLLVTPIPHGELLLIKLAASFTRMQSFLTAAIVLQGVPLLALLGLLSQRATNDHNGLEVLLWTVAAVALFIFDRLQQIAFAGLLGLAAALLAESWGTAMAGAAALGSAAWLIRAMLVFGLTLALAGDTAVDSGQVFVIGIPTLIIALPSVRVGIVLVAGLILLQELAIRRLAVWLIRHAAGYNAVHR